MRKEASEKSFTPCMCDGLWVLLYLSLSTVFMFLQRGVCQVTPLAYTQGMKCLGWLCAG